MTPSPDVIGNPLPESPNVGSPEQLSESVTQVQSSLNQTISPESNNRFWESQRTMSPAAAHRELDLQGQHLNPQNLFGSFGSEETVAPLTSDSSGAGLESTFSSPDVKSRTNSEARNGDGKAVENDVDVVSPEQSRFSPGWYSPKRVPQKTRSLEVNEVLEKEL